MAKERTTARGLGRVGPEPPSLQARVDWFADPPPAYVELRRAELVRERRVACLKIAGGSAVVAATFSVLVLGLFTALHPGLVTIAVFVAWGVRWLIPNVHALRETTKQLESLDRRPALPAARVVVREH